MADTSKATKYDLIQRERVIDDIWLCSSRPTEKCYKPCKVHNPAACDGAGLPGVEWDDDDVFEPAEESDDSPDDTSFSDSEVWDSDVDIIDEVTNEVAVVNREMERWMEVADMYYNQQDATQTAFQPSTYGMLTAQPSHPAYFPWNPATGHTPLPGHHVPPMFAPVFPMMPGALPVPFPMYSSTTQQYYANANNTMNNAPLPLISRTQGSLNQDNSSRAWDELIDEQERYQEERAAAMAAQTVGATEECVTSSNNVQSVSYFSASTDFWRRSQQQVDSQS